MEDTILKWTLFKDALPKVGEPVIILHNDGYITTFMTWSKTYMSKACKYWAYLPKDTGWGTR